MYNYTNGPFVSLIIMICAYLAIKANVVRKCNHKIFYIRGGGMNNGLSQLLWWHDIRSYKYTE